MNIFLTITVALLQFQSANAAPKIITIPEYPGIIKLDSNAYTVTDSSRFRSAAPQTPANSLEIESSSQAAKDSQLQRKVQDGISRDQTMSSITSNINISVNDGVVFLRGIVNSQNQRDKLKSIASGFVSADKIMDETQIQLPE